ncbi:hypothetical protein [Bacillus anthracis]
MSEQLSIFELEPYENNHYTVDKHTEALESLGFTYILPLGVDKQGRAGYRAKFEEQSCTVNIDRGHVMFKHDGSRFWDYIAEVKTNER